LKVKEAQVKGSSIATYLHKKDLRPQEVQRGDVKATSKGMKYPNFMQTKSSEPHIGMIGWGVNVTKAP